mmetsp:Transcript_78178/g.226057  ORF Transcript_78178/g.226057 Transcript_78178/m.226057 type:complete len:272 (+) Transcript_78178:94-909(+)
MPVSFSMRSCMKAMSTRRRSPRERPISSSYGGEGAATSCVNLWSNLAAMSWNAFAKILRTASPVRCFSNTLYMFMTSFAKPSRASCARMSNGPFASSAVSPAAGAATAPSFPSHSAELALSTASWCGALNHFLAWKLYLSTKIDDNLSNNAVRWSSYSLAIFDKSATRSAAALRAAAVEPEEAAAATAAAPSGANMLCKWVCKLGRICATKPQLWLHKAKFDALIFFKVSLLTAWPSSTNWCVLPLNIFRRLHIRWTMTSGKVSNSMHNRK